MKTTTTTTVGSLYKTIESEVKSIAKRFGLRLKASGNIITLTPKITHPDVISSNKKLISETSISRLIMFDVDIFIKDSEVRFVIKR